MEILAFNQVLVLLHVILGYYISFGNCYTCSTPDNWLGIFENDTAAQNFRLGQQWPNGIVKYELHSSLSDSDKTHLSAAFEEYHTKTCIRFEPKTDSDQNYASIEYDHFVGCGLAKVCMRGGNQYVKVGPECRNKATFVHELGHTICLGHEHQRSDRDEYLNVNKKCKLHFGKQVKNVEARGLYDYASQMHYACEDCVMPKDEFVEGCGEQVTDGLSVLDVDNINLFYDCSGCLRHRWLAPEHFGPTRLTMLQNISPCRAVIHGELIIGTYQNATNVCTIVYEQKEYKLGSGNKFEIFTILDNNQSPNAYNFATVDDHTTKQEVNTILDSAIAGGYQITWNSNSEDGVADMITGYVGYAHLRDLDAWLEKDETSDLPNEATVFGTVWKHKNRAEAVFVAGGRKFVTRNYKVLICQSDTDMKVVAPWPVGLYKLEQPLSEGSEITFIASVPNNSWKITLLNDTHSNEFLFQNGAQYFLRDLSKRNTDEHLVRLQTSKALPTLQNQFVKISLQIGSSSTQLYIDGVMYWNVETGNNVEYSKVVKVENLDVIYFHTEFPKPLVSENEIPEFTDDSVASKLSTLKSHSKRPNIFKLDQPLASGTTFTLITKQPNGIWGISLRSHMYDHRFIFENGAIYYSAPISNCERDGATIVHRTKEPVPQLKNKLVKFVLLIENSSVRVFVDDILYWKVEVEPGSQLEVTELVEIFDVDVVHFDIKYDDSTVTIGSLNSLDLLNVINKIKEFFAEEKSA